MENYNVLLLSPQYEAINFINYKRAIKLLYKEKVEIISNWDNVCELLIESKLIQYPSIIRLKKIENRRSISEQIVFNRHNLIKRDKQKCQYCSKFLHKREITIDHIIPKSLGGKNDFLNCVISCHKCNNLKSNKTLEQSGLKLLRLPFVPTYIKYEPNLKEFKNVHNDWINFI